jgi:hypothetical protein
VMDGWRRGFDELSWNDTDVHIEEDDLNKSSA